MRKLLILFITIPLFSLSPLGTVQEHSPFIGKWIGEDNQSVGFLQFDQEGFVTLGVNGKVMGGKNFLLEGKRGNVTYLVYPETDPIELDIIMTQIETGLQKKLFCIARFRNDYEMEFAHSFQGERPQEFNENNSIVLIRED